MILVKSCLWNTSTQVQWNIIRVISHDGRDFARDTEKKKSIAEDFKGTVIQADFFLEEKNFC